MDRVHEGVHGPDPQRWSMDLETQVENNNVFKQLKRFDHKKIHILNFHETNFFFLRHLKRQI